jgi:hypothetical protein
MRRSHGLWLSILVGVGVALATLIAGVIAFGLVNVFLAWFQEAVSVNFGWLGPYFSLWKAVRDFVISPLIVVPYIGGWVASVLGVAYGVHLYFQGKTKGAHFV